MRPQDWECGGVLPLSSVSSSLRDLLSRIEKCLKCYRKYRDYSDEDRLRIREWCHEGVWFFPPCGKVKGFFGTGPIMFVCQRPSTRGGKIPSTLDLRFYKLLEKYGLENAHLTDLVKCRGLAGKISEEKIDNCFPYLEEEIEILKPKLIVAVGNYVRRELNKKVQGIAIERIPHYAARGLSTEKLEREIAKIAKKVRD